MSNTKHTPGPWSSASLDQDSNHLEVFAGTTDGEQVAVVKGHDLSTGKHYESIANARLIAAAPELLEALSIIANALSPNSLPVNGMMASYDHALMVREEADRAFEVARAAIAKATQP